MFDIQKIADKIRAARIEKNMTQTELADKMGVSYQAVSNWERCRSMPDISKFNDLCDVLGLTLDELLGDEREEADAVKKVMGGEPISLSETAKIAPIIPPRELESRVESSAGAEVSIYEVAALAPFLTRESWSTG